MAKPVLFVTRRLPPAVEARAVRDYDARLNPDDTRRTGADIVRLAEGADAVLCCPAEKLDADTIRALPASVKVLGTFSVGYDHIDLAALRARHLPLVNTPDVLSVATAELAMLLILASARRAGESQRLLRAGRWTGWCPAAGSASSAWAASAASWRAWPAPSACGCITATFSACPPNWNMARSTMTMTSHSYRSARCSR